MRGNFHYVSGRLLASQEGLCST